jgi:hypothetical protein
MSAPVEPNLESRLKGFRPLRDLPPFAIAALIVAYVLRGKDWDQVVSAMAHVNLPLFLLGAGLFVVGYFFVNAFSYWLLYNWFLTRVRLGEMLKVFGAILGPQAIVPSLGHAIFLLYMITKKRLPILPTLGLSFFSAIIDLWVMEAVLALSLLVMPKAEPIILYAFLVLTPAMLFVTWYFPGGGGRRLLPSIYGLSLLRSLRAGSWRQYGLFFLIRLVWQAIEILAHSLALMAIGIGAPLGILMVLVVLMAVTSMLPITALGFGAPNLVAEYYAPYVAAGHSPGETAAAYGILFQTAFLLGRLLLGAVFAIPFWREVWKPMAAEPEKE